MLTARAPAATCGPDSGSVLSHWPTSLHSLSASPSSCAPACSQPGSSSAISFHCSTHAQSEGVHGELEPQMTTMTIRAPAALCGPGLGPGFSHWLETPHPSLQLCPCIPLPQLPLSASTEAHMSKSKVFRNGHLQLVSAAECVNTTDSDQHCCLPLTLAAARSGGATKDPNSPYIYCVPPLFSPRTI